MLLHASVRSKDLAVPSIHPPMHYQRANGSPHPEQSTGKGEAFKCKGFLFEKASKDRTFLMQNRPLQKIEPKREI